MPRPRAWSDTLLGINIDGGQLSFNLLSNLAASDTKTVVRLVGEITFFPSVGVTTGETVQAIDIGVMVVSGEAFTAGVFPDPETDSDTPTLGWLFRTRVGQFVDSSATIPDSWHTPVVRFDIRAGRKVDRGVLVMVMDKSVLDGVAHTLRVVGIVRALCLT